MTTRSLTTPLCRQLGVEHPIFAFSHSVDVTIQVTLAGGFAVLGVARDHPDHISQMIREVRAAVGHRRFGVDLMLPKLNSNETSVADLKRKLPVSHTEFVEGLAAKYQVPSATRPHFFTETVRSQSFFEDQLQTVLDSDVDLVACAVGVPTDVIQRIKEREKIALALVGAPKHARSALAADVDILVAQGTDAGGHTGPIGTFTLVPQVIEVAGNLPVITAGGIGHGRQIAAALAMGAQGAWLGTAWLTTREHGLSSAITDKLIAAGSEDTLLTRAHSGKSCRVIKSAWTDEWHAAGAPDPLPMPYQHALTGSLLAAVEEHEVLPLLYSPAGQSVAWSRNIEGTREVVDRLVTETRLALDALISGLDECRARV